MGCTPSIHVSQTGVVYCQDSGDESGGSPLNSGGVGGCVGGVGSKTTTTTATTAASAMSHITTTVTTTVVGGTRTQQGGLVGGGPKLIELKGLPVSISEAETQTHRDSTTMTGGNKPIQLGPMHIQQHPMAVLLVFAKEDAQSDGFWWAADRGGYVCNLARNAEGALESYLDKHHDLVIIDARSSKHFDAEALCRSIRKSSESTVIVAVTKKLSADKEEPSVIPFLNAGFNRRFIENPSISVCLNELVSLEHGEVRSQAKLGAANAWLKALELTTEAVHITNEQHVTQYVNPAYERLFGYTLEELQGQDSWQLPPPSEKFKPNLQESIQARLRKGEAWEGIYSSKRKGGDSISHHCRITPVNPLLGQTGKIRHYVSIRSPIVDGSQSLDRYSSDVTTQLPNGGVHTHSSGKRRESVARIHSMTIEAPITKSSVGENGGRRALMLPRSPYMPPFSDPLLFLQSIHIVINIINAAQENSPLTVVNALDKVLEILQSSELYSPYFGAQVRDDQMTNDLVGGLMATSREHSLDIQSTRSARSASQSIKRRFSGGHDGSLLKPTAVTSVTHGGAPPSDSTTGASLLLTNMPQNVCDVLNNAHSWDFDIMGLERFTNKQALAYLGMKTFQRFGVSEYLRCSEETLCNWLQLIEANYHTANTYHNSTHAADVMQASAYFLGRDKIKSIMEQSDEVVSLIAATVHDLNHPGKTNSFLVNAGHELALLYNDLAVLESHHSAMAFQLTWKNDRANIFKNVDKDDYKVLRQQIIDMVLATEMTKHFEHLSKFVSSANALIKDDDRECSLSGKSSPDSLSTASRLSSPETRMLIKRMLIKCADVSNPLRPLQMCKEWAFRISEEYFRQTDEEKTRNLPVVMPVFDRKKCNVPNSQTSFIDFFIKDMFDAWDNFCDIPVLISHLHKNYSYWKEQEPKAAKELMDRQRKEEEEEEEEEEDVKTNADESTS